MSILTKLTDLGRELAVATKSVQENIATLRAKIAARRTALSHAEEGPYPREEIRARIRAWVAEQGEAWRTHHAPDLVYTFGSPHDVRVPWNASTPVTWGALCRYAPQIAATLIADMEAQEYEAGPSSADRPSVVAQLKAELAELEATEEHAVDEASAVGVTIAHRPEVIERRQGEARARQLADEATRAQREREAAVNTQHAQRQPSSVSPYLTAHPSARQAFAAEASRQ